MKTVYKLLFSGMLVFVFVSLFSVSAFAEDISFVISDTDRPALQYVNSTTVQVVTSVVYASDGNYYLVDWVQHNNYNANTPYYFEDKFYFNCGSLANSSYAGTDNYLYQGFLYSTVNRSGVSTTMPYEIYIYDVSGDLVESWNNTAGFNITYSVGLKWFSNHNRNGSTSGFTGLIMSHYNDYVPIAYSGTYSDVNSYFYNNSSNYSDISTLIDSDQSLINLNGSVYSSIEDNIYLNGVLVFGTGSNIGGSNIHGSGSITPEYDQNGNIVNYNFQYEADYSQFFDSDGQDPEDFDSSTIDDYNSFDGDVQDSLSDFKGEFAFSDIFGDEFDLTSFRGAMIFWQDRFDEVMDLDPVFPTIVVSMLTFGIIAVILGRRLGVG